jgi:serine/threonine protein kinase/tetratricopeptide (TPR) repeat protein
MNTRPQNFLNDPSSAQRLASDPRPSSSTGSAGEINSDFESVLWHKLQQRRCDDRSNPAASDSKSRHSSRDANPVEGSFRLGGGFLESASSLPSRERGVPIFPHDSIFGFYLEQKLGSGAFASVFLARQQELPRLIALKVSEIEGNEPQTLAQLQHTNIVPIYSVHEDPDAGLRAVCMPYFGGAALSTVLTALEALTPRPTHGVEFLTALKRAGGPPVSTDTTHEPCAEHDAIQRISYVKTVAWLTAQLADGLFHAHQHNVLHRDIKPSNILIASSGVPMLLDFNLAAPVRQTVTGAKSSLGGTVAYMAPEHLRALATRDVAVGKLVDKRSDIYSLGMVFFEMLAGRRPFEHAGSYSAGPLVVEAMAQERGSTTPSIREVRDDVPWSLESVVRRCLHPDPEQRYQSARELAVDLRAFLEDKPLVHAPELSVAERVGKFFRRHPRVQAGLGVACVASLLLAIVTVISWSLHNRASASLASERERAERAELGNEKRRFESAAKRALCLVHTTVEGSDHLRQGIQDCEKALSIFNVLADSSWQERSAWQRLGPEERVAFGEQARELLLLLASGRVRSHPGDATVVEGALELLRRAEAIKGLQPARVIFEDQAMYLRLLGRDSEADKAHCQARSTPLASARDHYLMALSLARKGGRNNLQQARLYLDKALEFNPPHFWSLLQRGIVHCELRDWDSALMDFAWAKGVWPDSPLSYFSLGYIHDQKGRKDKAIEEYTAAIQRDPQCMLAYFNRGLVYAEMKQHDKALQDFDQVAKFGRRDAALLAARAFSLDALDRTAEAEADFHAAFQKLPHASPETRGRIRLVYGFAKADNHPAEAMRSFQDVLDDSACQVEHARAHYGLAMIHVRQDRLATGQTHFDRALDLAPDFAEARRYRAICQARQKNWSAAFQDIAWCVNRSERTGADLYAAACFYSLAAAGEADASRGRTYADEAMKFLRQAFTTGYGQDKAEEDPDLDGIRRRADFQQLVKKPDV